MNVAFICDEVGENDETDIKYQSSVTSMCCLKCKLANHSIDNMELCSHNKCSLCNSSDHSSSRSRWCPLIQSKEKRKLIKSDSNQSFSGKLTPKIRRTSGHNFASPDISQAPSVVDCFESPHTPKLKRLCPSCNLSTHRRSSSKLCPFNKHKNADQGENSSCDNISRISDYKLNYNILSDSSLTSTFALDSSNTSLRVCVADLLITFFY